MTDSLSAEQAYVIVDIVQPQRRLNKRFKDLKEDKALARYRREKKGADEFQIDLEKQNQWTLDRLTERQVSLDALASKLSVGMAAYMKYLLTD